MVQSLLNRGLLEAEDESESHNSRLSNDAIAVGSNGTEAVSQFDAVTQ